MNRPEEEQDCLGLQNLTDETAISPFFGRTELGGRVVQNQSAGAKSCADGAADGESH